VQICLQLGNNFLANSQRKKQAGLNLRCIEMFRPRIRCIEKQMEEPLASQYPGHSRRLSGPGRRRFQNSPQQWGIAPVRASYWHTLQTFGADHHYSQQERLPQRGANHRHWMYRNSNCRKMR
jgi:hypothetical protein